MPKAIGVIGGFTPPARRAGFTLVELLVALSIFVILTIMTIGAINLSITSERVRGAARQVQAMLEGARDRAISNRRTNPDNPRPVGVRLLVDESNPTICTSMVYIESPGLDTSLPAGVTTGMTKFVRAGVFVDGPTAYPALYGTGTDNDWQSLFDRGLIGPGSRMSVARVGGSREIELTIHPATFKLNNPSVLLTVQNHPDNPASALAPNNRSMPLSYALELEPDVMAGEDPLSLPRGTCIDLKNCALPGGWVTTTASGSQFSNHMDIMFSARGPVIGKSAATGLIHLYLITIDDALEGASPGSPATQTDFDGDGALDERHGEELGITIFTKAGRTISHPINPIVPNETPDPWRFGRQGEVAR